MATGARPLHARIAGAACGHGAVRIGRVRARAKRGPDGRSAAREAECTCSQWMRVGCMAEGAQGGRCAWREGRVATHRVAAVVGFSARRYWEERYTRYVSGLRLSSSRGSWLHPRRASRQAARARGSAPGRARPSHVCPLGPSAPASRSPPLRDPEAFDWYQRYSGLKELIAQYIKKSDKILNVGAGNSRASRPPAAARLPPPRALRPIALCALAARPRRAQD